MSHVIALVFDFDDTLTPDSTTQLLVHHGIDPEDFWGNKVAKRVLAGWDPTLAFLEEIFVLTKPGNPLEGLSNAALFEFGKTLKFYPGLPDIFEELRAITREYPLTLPTIEVYVISGGFEQLIRGSTIAPFLTDCWGVSCVELEDTHTIARPSRIVDFTAKTRFLFEINKGVGKDGRSNPFLVNEYLSPDKRRVPFSNIVYCGDGLTDVPSFSVVQARGGTTFALFDPARPSGVKRAWEKFLLPKRVSNMCFPRYTADDELGVLLRMAVRSICSQLETSAKIG
ncbi:MAG: hydrolase [Hymenobacter sp.]|nr:hydrolase [Hymenobacter sp.]